MKTNFASGSAFYNPRAVLGLVLCSIGVLLAVAALSKSVANSLGVTQSAVTEHGVARAPDQLKSNADWPQYGFDPEHTSFNPVEALLGTDNVSTLTVAWQYFFPCSTYSSPVVVDGVLYTGSYCGDFEALDAVTGQVLWSKSYLGGVIDSAAVADGVVYVTAKEAATVYAFNASTGAPVWTAHTGDWIYSNPTVWNGIVFVGAADGKLYAFDAGSGTTLWTTAALNIIESPSVADGIAYVGASDGHLYALDAATGASIWTADTGGSNATPAVANGVVYEGGLDDHLYAFDASNGTVLWIGTNGGTSPAVANGMVYVGSAVQRQLYAFDAEGCGSPSCSPIWTAPTQGIVTAAPAVANGVVYAGAWDRYLYAFDAAQGTRLWTYTATSYYSPGCLCPSPSVVNGMLYVGVTFGYQLYAFDLPEPNPVPLISQPLVPDAVAPGGAGFTLTVNGTGFVSGSVVNWNGSARATTFVSNSQLTASIMASDIATASTASVTVVNPTPGGGTSNVEFFPITLASSSLSVKRSDYVTATGPSDVGVADFNGDGEQDLAVPDFFSAGVVSILLGNGDGTFNAHVDYATGHGPGYVVVVDFNEDSKLDLAVNSQDSNVVSVLLGKGDGTFQPVVNYAVGTRFGALAAGDFNGDGNSDLASTSFSDNTVSVLLGKGDGTFRGQVVYAAGSGPYGITAGDFNRDGKLDLATADINSDSIAILLGNGDGTFQLPVEYQAGNMPNWINAADLNFDGFLDLVITNTTSSTVSILLGNGDGTFQSHVDYSVLSGSNSSRVADFNGDGKLDLAVTPRNLSDVVSILLGNGDGTFQVPVEFATGSEPLGLAAGDFNDDGRLDLAVANLSGNAVSVLLQATTVALSDTSLKFRVQLVGTASTAQTVTLTNSGPITLTISSIAASGDFLQKNNCGSSLPAGESCTIKVGFKPTAKGTRTGELIITDNAPDSPQTVTLTGTGTVVELSPTSLNFGDQRVGTISPPQTVRLTNTGSTPLSIRGIAIVGNNFSDFVESTTCGSIVPANSSCAIDVRFRPTATGPRTASVKVRHDGGGAQAVELRGRGVSSE